MILFQLFGIVLSTPHEIGGTTRVDQFLEPWKFPKWDCANGVYKAQGYMCGRKSNFDPGNYDKCRYSRSLNILHRMSVSIRPIQIVEEDIAMYRIKSFDPRMPSLDMNKIVVSGHKGSSLEFDFTKPLIGVIIWAYNQNGVWKTGDGSSNSIIVHMIVADIYKSKRENLANSLEDMFGEDFKKKTSNVLSTSFRYLPTDGRQKFICDWVFTTYSGNHSGSTRIKDYFQSYSNDRGNKVMNMVKYAINRWLVDGYSETYLHDIYKNDYEQKSFFPDNISLIKRPTTTKPTTTTSTTTTKGTTTPKITTTTKRRTIPTTRKYYRWTPRMPTTYNFRSDVELQPSSYTTRKPTTTTKIITSTKISTAWQKIHDKLDCIHPDDPYGMFYKGDRSYTKFSNPCIRWDQLPKSSKFHPAKFHTFDLRDNVCRNPDGDDSGPWCFISLRPIKYGYCGISECSETAPRPSYEKLVNNHRNEILTTKVIDTETFPRTTTTKRPTRKRTTTKRTTSTTIIIPTTFTSTTTEIPSTIIATTEGNGPLDSSECYDFYFYSDYGDKLTVDECLNLL